jgi:hypothetical protein
LSSLRDLAHSIVVGCSRLKHYLLLQIVAFVIGIAGVISIAIILVTQMLSAHRVDLTPVFVYAMVLSILNFASTVLYYDASRKLSIWSQKFKSYGVAALVIILITVALAPISAYLTISILDRVNSIVNKLLELGSQVTTPEVLQELVLELNQQLQLLMLVSALIVLVTSIINIYLVGIFRDVKEAFVELLSSQQLEEYAYGYKLWRLDDATKFLRIALILMLIGDGFSYIGLRVINGLLGIVALVLWFLGVARAWGGLEEVRQSVPGLLVALESRQVQQQSQQM